MRFMAAPIDLRNDFDSVSLPPREEDQGRDPGRRLLALAEVYDGGSRTDASPSAASVCRSFATGCCASTPADRTGWSMGSHRAHPRSSTPITAAHWRIVEAGGPGVDGVVRWRRKDLPGGSGDVRHLARRDHGRARVEGGSASPRSRCGRATTRKTSWPSRLLKKTSPPNWRRSGRGSRKASR